MIDAKLKGEGIDLDAAEPVASTNNVIDLMAALKKSLGQSMEPTIGESLPVASVLLRAARK